MQWPSQSPHLNLTEHLREVSVALQQMRKHVLKARGFSSVLSSSTDLEKALKLLWKIVVERLTAETLCVQFHFDLSPLHGLGTDVTDLNLQ